MITLDFSDRRPIYEQLQEKITRMALSGVLQPNEQLPSVRSLAKDLMVNPNTIQKVYQILEQDGVVYSVPGKGSFISPEIMESTKYREESRSRLLEAAANCKLYGLKKQEALEAVEQVYGEETKDAADS